MKTKKQKYRLEVKKIIGKKFDDLGNSYFITKWEDVEEINLGSVNKPKEDILEVRYAPLIEEKAK